MDVKLFLYRKEHHLTQIELSEKSGVGLRFVRELEQGKKTLRLDKVNQVLNLDRDYRRWGPGYWWQNTRLPYISLTVSGDFDLMQPFFKMYADDIYNLCKYRTKKYFNFDGVCFPECMYFWGLVLPMIMVGRKWKSVRINCRIVDGINGNGWQLPS